LRVSILKKIIKEIREGLEEPGNIAPLLSNLGFTDGRKAATNLHLLRRDIQHPQAFNRLLPVIIESSVEVPDPDMALNNLERFVSFHEDKEKVFTFLSHHKEVVSSLLLLFGSSQYLSTFLFSAPQEYLGWLSTPDLLKQPVSRGAMLSDLRREITLKMPVNEVKTILRRFRKREYVRIALRDMLEYGTLAEITQEISNVADVCLQMAYEVCNRDLQKRYGRPLYTDRNGQIQECQFAVLGMGKHGGEELNYSSDIDIMFLYTSDNGETESGTLTNHQYFVKLSEMISQVIGATTEEGFVFRVDTRLRPEGEKGDLACSLRSYEIYYESWGQTWERTALLKVRPVAGDDSLGRAFLAMIHPFVYRKYLDFTAIDEIREMKAKIDKNIAIKGKETRNVKLGYGGIREIEFFVQALQLLYGGKEPWVRERNTLRALHRLAQKGFISYEEEELLSKAYHLLRRIEHMIQIVGERQTQIMPADTRELMTLAKRIGYQERGRYRAHELLLKDYGICTQSVRKIYDGLFTKKAAEEEHTEEVSDGEVIVGDVVSEEEAAGILARHHFKDPRKAYRNVVLLREGPPFSHQTPRSRQIFLRIFPAFFSQIAASSDPDLALNHLEALISSVGARETLYSFFEENPQAIESVIRLFSSSEYLSKIVIRHPEIVDQFLDPAEMLRKRTREEMQGELFSLIGECGTYAERLDALRKFKYTEELHIGYNDILGNMDTMTVSRSISMLADISVAGALRIAEEELRRIYGRPACKTGGTEAQARFCIIGMGKLGGEEITYGSDLDIVFIYSGEGETQGGNSISNHEYFAHLAGKVMSVLTSMTREGTVFRVDVRLRPSGSKGPLCQSIEAFAMYIKGHADIWELQSLTRVRVIAGDQSLGSEFMTMAHELLYNPPLPSVSPFTKGGLRGNGEEKKGLNLAGSIRAMRQRMEAEVSKEDSEHYDIKVGPGGIVDIEFMVQYLQLLHGSKYPGIRVTHTLLALEALHREGLLSKDRYLRLRKSYTFLRTLESRLRIVHNMPSHLLPRDPERLAPLAHRMGYQDTKRISGAKRLIKDIEDLRKRVRGIFEEVLADKRNN